VAKTYELSHETVGQALVMRASGKFDQAAGSAVEALLSESQRGVVVLNLSEVEYISSTGIAMIVKMTAAKGLRLAALADCVANTLSLAGIEKILSIYADEEAARNASR